MKADRATIDRIFVEGHIAAMSSEAMLNGEALEEFCEGHNITFDGFLYLLKTASVAAPAMDRYIRQLDSDANPVMEICSQLLQVGVRLGFQAAQLERQP